MNRLSSVLIKGVRRAAPSTVRTSLAPLSRSFAEELTIPTDKEQQAGRRKEELDAEAAGSVGFNRDPIIPASDAGTKENPILVSSVCKRESEYVE